ncbi:RluA family pseudouridine synthase [Niallia sp. 03133]|uniref:RluA family pseudouridine synthase n=1 Tax=Niallia sp. 03133 TaxID=3458060 RepID=UPI0040440B28
MLKTERKGEWLFIHIPSKWNGMTIEEIFHTVLYASKKQIHLFKMGKKVMLNDRYENWKTTVQTKDLIKIKLFNDDATAIQPTYMDLPILYEDDFLLVVNKPAYIDTHPNAPEDHSSLLNGVVFHVLMNGEERQVKHIHRLDKNTSGCILFAKHELIGNILDQMLRERKIKRTYVAMAHGFFSAKFGTINKPIGRDRHHGTRRRISVNGQNATTHYKVLQQLKKDNLSLITCSLDTGRTHQIRVHLSSINHPLAGDTLYGGKAVFPRQALHAVKIQFTHPITEEKIECYAPFLDDPAIFPSIDIYSI